MVFPLYLSDYKWGLCALALTGTAFGLIAWRIHSSSNVTGIEIITVLSATAVLGLYAGTATLMFLP